MLGFERAYDIKGSGPNMLLNRYLPPDVSFIQLLGQVLWFHGD